MPVLIVVPRVDSKLGPFWHKIIWKSQKLMFFSKVMFFSEKEAPGRAAPNRRPSWECTRTPISIKINWKSIKIKKTAPRQPSLFLSLKNWSRSDVLKAAKKGSRIRLRSSLRWDFFLAQSHAFNFKMCLGHHVMLYRVQNFTSMWCFVIAVVKSAGKAFVCSIYIYIYIDLKRFVLMFWFRVKLTKNIGRGMF